MKRKMDLEKKWWEEPIRMLRVDYAPDFSLIKEENLKELARSRKKDWGINCEWIVGIPGFVGGGYRTTFHASGYQVYPGFENFDYLRTYTPLAHQQGIKVISYLNMHWYSYEFAEQHPGWEQITTTGQSYGRVNPLYGNGTTFCVNTSWRDWAFGLMKEAMKTGIDGIFLDGPVIFPDCCYCAACQKKFKADYGVEIPQENWQNPLWKKFLEFREDSLAQFLKDSQSAIREINPEGVIFLNARNWGPSGWRCVCDIQKVGPYQTFNGAEAFFHYGRQQNIYASLMTAKYLRAAGKPTVVFTHYMNGLWHYLFLPAGEVKLALTQTLAGGANPWLAFINTSLKSQPAGNKPVKEIFRFQERHKEIYSNTEPLTEIGLLFSSRTSRYYLSRWEEIYTGSSAGKEENLIMEQTGKKVLNWPARKKQTEGMLSDSYLGYFHVLTRNHFLFDILLDQDLQNKDLTSYKMLILPDAACLDEKSILKIREFVQQGGCLLTSFEAGFYDGQGNYTETLFDLLGIDKVEGCFPVTTGENYIQVMEDYFSFPKGSLVERSPYALKVKARPNTEIPFFFLEPMVGSYVPLKGLSSYPALVINHYGPGKVVYFPEALGSFFGTSRMISAEKRIVQALQKMNEETLLETQAPATVSLEIYRQGKNNRLIVHLINNTVDDRPVKEFLPVKNIMLKLNLPKEPREILVLRENKKLKTSFQSGKLILKISTLSTYEVIVIQF